MLINKENMPLVAMEFMNEVHTEDVEIINELYELVLSYEHSPTEANKELVDEKFTQWYDHTVEHFKKEEEMMIEKNFPPYPMHKGEHERALLQMREVYKQWSQKGDIAILKTYLSTELPAWLVQHIQSMDTVTAMFFKTGLSPCSVA